MGILDTIKGKVHDVKNSMKGLPTSRLDVDELIKLSSQPFFKTSIQERASEVGDFKYIGFKYTYHRTVTRKLVVYVNLYFYVKGSRPPKPKSKKTKRSSKRETYLLVAKFPYTTEVKNMKRLYNLPMQIFSSDPSFKFYFAYALNQMNAVVTDDEELVNWLGKSMTTKPKINNPQFKVQLTKHFYKFFKFIANSKPKDYLDQKWMMNPNTRVKIFNENT